MYKSLTLSPLWCTSVQMDANGFALGEISSNVA